MIIDAVGFRISHTKCEKCGSDNIQVIWRCDEPSTISYECQETNCGHVSKENQEIDRAGFEGDLRAPRRKCNFCGKKFWSARCVCTNGRCAECCRVYCRHSTYAELAG